MKPLFPRAVVTPKKGALLAGAAYLLFYLFGFQPLLPYLAEWLKIDPASQNGNYLVNVIFFSVNFIAVALIFRPFLLDSLAPVKERRLGWFFLPVGIAYGLCAVTSNLITVIYEILQVTPENLNNEAVGSMLTAHPAAMLLFTVVLAPIYEECLFRGVLFTPFCKKCPWVGYVLSVLLFSGIHVVNAIGMQSPVELILCFVQYVPLSLFLCWACQKTRSIWGSITLHALINGISCLFMLLDSAAGQAGGLF